MKKKFLALMLSFTMVMSMAACGNEDTGDGDKSSISVSSSTDVSDFADSSSQTAEGANDGFSLWNVTKAVTPDLSGTTWNLCGGYLNGQEMTQEDLDVALEAYKGTCQFVFDGEGGAKMVQGGGELTGTYQYLQNGDVGIIINANGSELRYGCVFTDLDGLTMIAVTDEEGKNGLYFAQ